MAIVKGVVEVASINKWGKFNMLVNEMWYSTKPEWLSVKPTSGQTVEFDDGGKNYIKNLRIVEGSVIAPSSSVTPFSAPKGRMGSFPIAPDDGQRSIIRQNALTNARELYCLLIGAPIADPDHDVVVRDILYIARKFESYTSGDIERYEAEAAMKEMEKEMGV